jgi:hypothetical protein
MIGPLGQMSRKLAKAALNTRPYVSWTYQAVKVSYIHKNR